MNFFTALLISIVLATVVYCVMWRIIIGRFRVNVYNLLYYKNWVRIDTEVGRIIFKVKGENTYDGLIVLDKSDEEMELEISDDELVKIIGMNRFLFDMQMLDPTKCEIIPNSKFSQVAEQLKPTIIKTSNKLHNRFENYPEIVQAYLDGANKLLIEIDKGIVN